MATNRNRSLVRSMLEQHQCCELCGKTHNLDVHHIIPLSCALGNVDLDVEENLIVICPSCHARLTRKSLLTRLGLERVQFPTKVIVEYYESIVPEDDTWCDLLTKADEMYFKMMDFLHVKSRRKKGEEPNE